MANFTQFKNTRSNPEVSGVTDVSPDEVLTKLSDVCLIDVRRPDEFHGELGHIKGAKLVVLDTLPEHIDEFPKDKTIVFVCKSGGRSARATAFAKEQGLEHTYNMEGGMLLWNKKHFEIEKE